MWSTAKIAGGSILFGLSFVCALVPCITVRCLVGRLGASPAFKRAISILNCFSGGVFFATSVLDLLPEAREAMEEMFQLRDLHIEFPLTECIMGAGFLFILFLEQFAMRCFSNIHTSKSSSIRNKADRKRHNKEMVTSIGCTLLSDSLTPNSSPTDDVIIPRNFEDSSCLDDVPHLTYGAIDGHACAARDKQLTWSHEKHPTVSPHNKPNVIRNGTHAAIPNDDVKITDGKREEYVETGIALQYAQKKEDRRVFVLRSLVLLGALSIHMVFDGLALGLLDDESDIWQITLALSIHKSLVFFTIGLQLLELLKSVCKTVAAALIFSLVSPLGVVIGELVISGGNEVTRVTVTAVLQSIATGTFIFVTFFEILQRELNDGDHDLFKVLATIIGFALIAVVKLFTHED